MGLLSKGQDVELIKRILDNNDRKAADELVSRYYKCVYKHIYIKVKDEETGMDITQETFIAALRGLGSFNDAKASFKTWLTRIADNKVTDYFRSRQYHERVLLPRLWMILYLKRQMKEQARRRVCLTSFHMKRWKRCMVIIRIVNGRHSD